ncbi:MAG: LytTR family transcriptional regulator [Lachnospiraceae bacterium]|nr:LytTR family transcriptional regulator [Lachnospiraceae bacterium]
MQIKAVINENFKDLELHVCKDKMDSEVREIISTLHGFLDSKIVARDEIGNTVNLRPGEVISLYASNQKVYALSSDKQYTVQKKLYELENELEKACFVRISKSELVNYKMIKCLDMSMTGTIKLVMKNGYETYTSRRNIVKIKEVLVKGNER